MFLDPDTRTPSPETRQEHWQNVFNANYKKSTDITDSIILDHHSGPVIFAQFSPDDKLVVSSSTDKTLKVIILEYFKMYKYNPNKLTLLGVNILYWSLLINIHMQNY